MVRLQEWFQSLEQGQAWRRSLVILALLGTGVGYNWLCFRNFNTLEAMDAAQVARNVAAGHGFSTQFIRPLSVHLVRKHQRAVSGNPQTPPPDPGKLNSPHPDLANPPLYPLLLAGWMKVYSQVFPTDPDHKLWSYTNGPRRDPHEFFIGLFNQGLFLGVLALTFFLARRLFDAATAWLTSALLLGCELMWRFSISGLPTLLLVLITLGVVWLLVRLEADGREPGLAPARLWGLAVALGVLVGLGALTRYAYAWVIVPVVIFIGLFHPRRRAALNLAAVVAFVLVLTPWLVRNYHECGLPFGLASYAPLEATYVFPDYQLARSLEPDFNLIQLRPLIYKLMSGMHQLFLDDLPRLGGSWATAFFLVGLMLGFRNPALQRLRYFIVATLFLFLVVQSLVRTQASEEVKVVNADNLLIVLFPLLLMYGVGFFFVLLEQINFEHPLLRQMAIGGFALVMCLPLLDAFLPPRNSVLAYPPYHPPIIRQTAGLLKADELLISDVPWAVAWYGQRQCLWLTLNSTDQFWAVHNGLKPIHGLYLTPRTMDSQLLTGEALQGWHEFVIGLFHKEVPVDFPLQRAPRNYLPEQVFLTDREH